MDHRLAPYNRNVAVLRFLAVLVLSVWLGGLAILGLAAPILFTTLQAADPAGGRELAGLAFGAVFRTFQTVAWLCGGALVALFALRAALGPRPRRLAARIWTLVAMLAISIASAVVIAPEIDRLRASTTGPIAALADDNPVRKRFNQLHGLANGLMLVTMAGGVALLWFESTDTH